MNILCFFFNDTATTEIYTLSLHDALPISGASFGFDIGTDAGSENRAFLINDNRLFRPGLLSGRAFSGRAVQGLNVQRSEEHTSELQSRQYLVCRLLLEKKINQLFLRLTHY